MSILIQRNSVVALGTSITFITADAKGDSRGASCWFTWATLLSNARMVWTRNSGLLGDTSAGMISRFKRDVVAWGATWCVLEVGTNDAYVLNLPVAQFAANVRTIVDLAQQNRINLILTTVMQRSDVFSALVPQYNAFLTRLSQEKGLPLIDFYSAVLDPTTGLTNVANTSDGLHPSPPGARLMGQAAANVAAVVMPSFSPILGETNNTDDLNLVGSPLFLTNTAGLGTNWVQTGTGVPSVVVGTQPVVGNFQRLTVNPDNANATINSPGIVPGGLWTPGIDAISFSGWIQSACTGATAGAMVQILFFLASGGFTTSPLLQLPGTFGPNLFYTEVAIPPTTSVFEIFFGPQGGTGGNDFVQIAQPTVLVLSRSPLSAL